MGEKLQATCKAFTMLLKHYIKLQKVKNGLGVIPLGHVQLVTGDVIIPWVKI